MMNLMKHLMNPQMFIPIAEPKNDPAEQRKEIIELDINFINDLTAAFILQSIRRPMDQVTTILTHLFALIGIREQILELQSSIQ